MDPKSTVETAITAPASHVPPFVPVQTVLQLLPFSDLRWENFEKLCYRLAGKDADVEYHSLYGRTGQAQQGIDIFARKRNSKYNAWQAKCYKNYSKNDLQKACSTFLSGAWVRKTEEFIIAVQCPVDDVNLQNAIEEQADKFRAQGIILKVLGGHDLCTALRSHPDIVLEFFGRECAKKFFGDTVNADLLLKLDGTEIQKVRVQLQRVYQAGFELLDKIPVNAPTPFSNQPNAPISLLERFSTPDVLLKENVLNHLAKTQDRELTAPTHDLQLADTSSQLNTKEEGRKTEQYRRTPILSWLAESDQIAVIGHAGTGKSTVLRCLALDLLGQQQRFTDVAKKWGRHLPLFISFAKWVRLTEANVEAVGIKELIRATWQQQLTADLVTLIDKAIDESRVVLFVDGLDEWANEQAARTTLQALLTIVSAHSIPVVVSARPGGLSKIGGIPDFWAVGLLAPLSKLQQREIATIWFSRNVVLNNGYSPNEESVLWQTNRFFKELHKGRGLSTLAETPLLLLGLIALAVRQIVLPINKVQALSQLTELLLELHPYSRATAAGDVVPRFSSAASIDVRREALAALAFEIRSKGGDAGYPIQLARHCIKAFLTDPEGFCYSPREALQVANEILSVNSETMGLLVEKGREEVGFVHASLEEYLASVHIHGWPIERILEFVRANASNFRWRSVFGDLIARNNRRSEAEQIVRVIDEPEHDAIGALQRRLLLADVVFGGAEINKPTALKLADRSLEIIEGAGWISERSAHLAASLEGVYNPTLREKTSTTIIRWGIRSEEYLHEFYQALSNWSRSENLLNILKHGVKDDNVQNARAAVKTLATVYKENSEVERWLISLLRGDTNLPVVGIVLEALTIGWPNNPALIDLLDSASVAKDKSIRLSAIWCKVQLTLHSDVDLEDLLSFVAWQNGIDYHHMGLAGQCLIQGWRNNHEIIKICINTLNGSISHRNDIDRDVAYKYLINSDVHNPSVCGWILHELKSERPFITMLRGDWEWILRFSDGNQEIREQLILTAISTKMEHQEYVMRPIFNKIEDSRIRQHLIDKVKNAKGFSIFWSLAPLLEGWAANHPDVSDLIQEVLNWPDERKQHVVSLYPKMLDREACIQELLRITKENENVRADLLLSAFSQLDIRSDKDIVEFLVATLLNRPETVFSASNGLIALCPDEPSVKKFALSKLEGRNPPLALLATVYHDEPNIQRKISEQVGSLTITMRQQIIDAASNEFDRNDTAKEILGKYDMEVDGQLKIQGAIKNYQASYPNDTNRQEVINRLLSDAIAVGYDHDERRAAAFAGLITYGATEQFAKLKWNNQPLDISFGYYSRESQALLRLIAEHWEDLDKSFDQKTLSRLRYHSSESHFWTLISPYVSSSPALRQKFIEHCISSTKCLELQELQALSKELPKSDLLLQHCLLCINNIKDLNSNATWPSYQRYFEASYILRDQFGGNSDLLGQLLKVLQDSNFQHGISAMAIYDPNNSSLDSFAKQILIEEDTLENYAPSIILAVSRFESKQLKTIVKRMINRPNHSLWDFQDRINYAIKSRIGSDEEFASLIGSWLASNPTENEISSFSRYLASTGKLDEEIQNLCQHLLNKIIVTSGIPAHGYDAISDLIRPVAHSLLDVLANPIH
ncbi:NACHT domain-containing protein [Aeromonas bestiarum]|uniref:NACHT domain-containing protein n=1 Tax=Aeromonas bestiarum TaxID=105751 RepID=UPI000A00EE60|nr:NACHT domain-containing protein [Aeromonas bestiarum]